MTIKHRTLEELEAGLPEIYQSPKDNGVIRLIVRRPKIGEREVLDEAQLTPLEGISGDTWRFRKS